MSLPTRYPANVAAPQFYALSATGPTICPACSQALDKEQTEADNELWSVWQMWKPGVKRPTKPAPDDPNKAPAVR